jgi:hypothetical protein
MEDNPNSLDSGGMSTSMNPRREETNKHMKKLLTTCVAALALLASVSTSKAAEPLPYTEGSVLEMTFIRILPGGNDAYLQFLQKEWKPVQEAAKKEGLILSYHVAAGMAANKDDWDMVLVVEYKNMGALDGLEEKYMAVSEKAAGSNKEQEKRSEDRNKIREVVGSKLVRELNFR